MSKGIYIEYYGWKPGTFNDVMNSIQHLRNQYYLDGPSNYDWVFYNEILFNRESQMYVDFIHIDEGYEWISPLNYIDAYFSLSFKKVHILKVSKALYSIGFTKKESLKMINETWKNELMNPTYHWQQLKEKNIETLTKIINTNLIDNISNDTISTIIEDWLFPLYSIETEMVKVNVTDLREIQNNWFV